MPDPAAFYAPSPAKIKTIIVVEDNGSCQTYPDLLSALTAVYRLAPPIEQHITEIITRTSELANKKVEK